MSADGTRLIGIAFAGFAEAENVENQSLDFGAIYEFSRTSTGWHTESLEPPATFVARSLFVASSGDLSRTLWELTVAAPGEETSGIEELEHYAFAVREATPSGVRFVAVGPENPVGAPAPSNFEFSGASADLSHVLFNIPASEQQVWPGDGTHEGARSLYEYVGTGEHEPTLVGVKNAGPLEGVVHKNEHAELLSACGTLLGSQGQGQGSAYNAVSANGAVVFFTALECAGEPQVNELYARIAGSRTVPISEPTVADCQQCKTGSRSNALFEGASQDGSKVFFLSEQELLPGAKGENLYEYDFGAQEGKRVTLIAPEAAGVVRISTDGSRVYFVSTAALSSSPDSSLAPGHQTPTAGQPNMYGFGTASGRMAFVVTLTAGNALDEEVWHREDRNRPAETTPSGSFLVFASRSDLTSDDTSSVRQIFEYDAHAESLVRVSRGQRATGVPERFGDDGDGEASNLIGTPNYTGSLKPEYAASMLSLSEQGVVVFTSADALAPHAVRTGHQNIYEYRGGNVYLISPADEAAPLRAEMSRLLGIDQSGNDVFFFTTTDLVQQSLDTQAAWYDAREGGGALPPVSLPGCAGDACQGGLSATPFLPAQGGSATIAGGGNLVPLASRSVVKPRSLTRAQKLGLALKACSRQPRKKRAACVRRAKRRFGRASRVASRHGGGK
jgi:hypothetical protein